MNRYKCPACGRNQYTSCDTAEGCIYCGHKELSKMETLEPEESEEVLMQFNKYQQLAERTANRGPDDTAERRFTNFAFGLAGETGEVIDCLKKHLFHGHPLDREKLKIELGDVMWYVATIATTADISLYEIASANIAKLKARYPEGFSEERSIHREDNT